MLLRNTLTDYRSALDPSDADALGIEAAQAVERFLQHREGATPTPLASLPALARRLGVESIYLKDEGHRLGLGSFKALGGAYAVIQLVLELASKQLGRPVDVS